MRPQELPLRILIAGQAAPRDQHRQVDRACRAGKTFLSKTEPGLAKLEELEEYSAAGWTVGLLRGRGHVSRFRH